MNQLFYEVTSKQLLNIIKSISENIRFKQFRLCGGTALALQTGHRISVDADFVSDKLLNSSEIIAAVNSAFTNVTDITTGVHGVFLKINNIKVDFLSWNIPFMHKPIIIDDIRMADVEEIIAMKLFAIMQRGEKKDYMDIVSLLSKYDLTHMLEMYKSRYIGSDELPVLRCLASFSDIENQPNPVMLNGLTWEESKNILTKKISSIIF